MYANDVMGNLCIKSVGFFYIAYFGDTSTELFWPSLS